VIIPKINYKILIENKLPTVIEITKKRFWGKCPVMLISKGQRFVFLKAENEVSALEKTNYFLKMYYLYPISNGMK